MNLYVNTKVVILFRELMNEGIFDIITDALHAKDKKLLLAGYIYHPSKAVVYSYSSINL